MVASGPVLVEFLSDGINTFRGFEMQWERRGAVDVVCSSETLRLSDGLSVTWSAQLVAGALLMDSWFMGCLLLLAVVGI